MKFVSLLLVVALVGCSNAPQVVKDAGDLGVAQIEQYNNKVDVLIKNQMLILDARLAQGLITQEKYDSQSKAMKSIAEQGDDILALEEAINSYLHEDLDWAEGLNDLRHAIVD